MIQQNIYNLAHVLNLEETYERLHNSPLVVKARFNEGNVKGQGSFGSIITEFKDVKHLIQISKKTVQFGFKGFAEKQQIMGLLFLHGIEVKPQPYGWNITGRGWPPPVPLEVLGCKGYVYNILQPAKTILRFRRGVHPLLWFLLFAIPSLLLLPKFF